jgi:SAM-dependent methyltransferase
LTISASVGSCSTTPTVLETVAKSALQHTPIAHPNLHQTAYPAASLKKTVRLFFFKQLLKTRAGRLAPDIIRALGNCTSLLDLGCGDMILTEVLQRQSPVSITALDTVDSNLSGLPLILYNGGAIPFDNHTFDATMVAYVLHHCSNIPLVLQEIKRVTRKKIIILEEIYQGKLAEKILHLHDSGNRFLSTKMHIPCNFLKIEQWLEVFAELDLHVEKCTRIYQYPFLNLTHQLLFELTPQ